MAYEIDFIGVSEEEAKKDADAIAFRWSEHTLYGNRWKIVVYDGGLTAHGKALVNLLYRHYFNGVNNKEIDAVILSHGDQDHAVGLKEVLNSFKVKALYMNRPWLYKDILYKYIKDRRITKESLERRLKESFPYIYDLEVLAKQKGIPIYQAFQGDKIEGRITVLSPSLPFYLQEIAEAVEYLEEKRMNPSLGLLQKLADSLRTIVNSVSEYWYKDSLREDVTTSPVNEASTIIFGELMDANILLVGDAGIKALDKAIEYAKHSMHKPLDVFVNFMQIPHHGGRHNVSPSILDRLVGPILPSQKMGNRVAYVSAAENSDHPYKMVVNGYVRRGVHVYKTSGKSIWRHCNMPAREDYSRIEEERFSYQVEEWND